MNDRFVLQADWNEALRSGEKKVWCGYKSGVVDSKTIYADLTLPKDANGSRDIAMQSSNKDITAQKTGAAMTLNYSDDGKKQLFYPPSSVLAGIHKKSVNCVDLSSGGLGVSSSADGSMLVWNAENGQVQRNLEGHKLDVYRCRLFPSGLVVLSGGCDMTLRVWSVETGDCVRKLTGHKMAVTDVGFIAKGAEVMSSSKDGTVKLWSCGSSSCLTTYTPEAGPVNSLHVHAPNGPTGGRLLAGCERNAVVLFDVATGKELGRRVLENSVNTVRWFADGERAVVGTQSGLVEILDVRNFKEPLVTRSDTGVAVLDAVTVAKDQLFIAYSDGTVSYWNDGPCSLDALPTVEFTGSDCDPVYNLSAGAVNGKRTLITGCRDGKIRSYDLEMLL